MELFKQIQNLTEMVSDGKLQKFALMVKVEEGDGMATYDDLEQVEIFVDQQAFKTRIVEAFREYVIDDKGGETDASTYDEVLDDPEYQNFTERYFIIDKF